MRLFRLFSMIAFIILLWLSVALPSATAASAPRGERRCGWFENPTPGNATLTDRETSWTIAEQGGHEASGDWPQFSDAQWMETGAGHHGYGCACLTAVIDHTTHVVQSIRQATARPLQVCRRDKSLHEPPHDLDD